LNAVLLFDGVCNLCNGAVRFVIERDPSGYFRFAALQSETGRELLGRFRLPVDALDTFILIEGEHCYARSDAGLRVAAHLSGAWPLVGVLRVLPRSWRDRVYRFVADHRYRWFGKRDSCMLPTSALQSRFLP
jgi:predicted DCC family thiol-disulfide oxidoreductase YuxK